MKNTNIDILEIINQANKINLLETRIGQQAIRARIRAGQISPDAAEKWESAKEKMGDDPLLKKITQKVDKDGTVWERPISNEKPSKSLRQAVTAENPKEKHIDKMRRGLKKQYASTGTRHIGIPSGGAAVAVPIGLTLPLPGIDKLVTDRGKDKVKDAATVSAGHLIKSLHHFKNGNYMGAHKSFKKAISHFKDNFPRTSIVVSPEEEKPAAAARRLGDKLKEKGKVGGALGKLLHSYADRIEIGAQRIKAHEGDEALRSQTGKTPTNLYGRGELTNQHMGMQVPHDEFNELRAYKASGPGRTKNSKMRKIKDIVANSTNRLRRGRIMSGEKGTDELVRYKAEREIRRDEGLKSKEPLTNKQVQKFEKKIYKHYEKMADKAKKRTAVERPNEREYTKKDGTKGVFKDKTPRIALSLTPDIIKHPKEYAKEFVKQKAKDTIVDFIDKKVKPEISRAQSIRRTMKKRQHDPDLKNVPYWTSTNRNWKRTLGEIISIYDESLEKFQLKCLIEGALQRRVKAGLLDPALVKQKLAAATEKGAFKVDPLKRKEVNKKLTSGEWDKISKSDVSHLYSRDINEPHEDTLERGLDKITSKEANEARSKRVASRDKAWKKEYKRVKKANKDKKDKVELPERPKHKPFDGQIRHINTPGPISDFVNFITPKLKGIPEEAKAAASVVGSPGFTLSLGKLHKKLPSITAIPSWKFVKSDKYNNILNSAREAAKDKPKLLATIDKWHNKLNDRYVQGLEAKQHEIQGEYGSKQDLGMNVFSNKQQRGKHNVDALYSERKNRRLQSAMGKREPSKHLDAFRTMSGEKGWLDELEKDAHKEYREKHGIGPNDEFTGKHVGNIDKYTKQYIRAQVQKKADRQAAVAPMKKFIDMKKKGAKTSDALAAASGQYLGKKLSKKIGGSVANIDMSKYSPLYANQNIFDDAVGDIAGHVSDYTALKAKEISDRAKQKLNDIKNKRRSAKAKKKLQVQPA